MRSIRKALATMVVAVAFAARHNTTATPFSPWKKARLEGHA